MRYLCCTAGYTLVYAKQLQKREYILEGTAELTNPSGTDAVNIQSLTIFLGTQQISPSCGALPAGELRLGATQQTSCPFSAAFSSGERAIHFKEDTLYSCSSTRRWPVALQHEQQQQHEVAATPAAWQPLTSPDFNKLQLLNHLESII